MARNMLDRFWADNSAHSFLETLCNYWTLWAARSPIEAKVSPYYPGLDWILDQAAVQDDFMKKMIGLGDFSVFSRWGDLARSQLKQFSLRDEFLDFKRLLETNIEFSNLPRYLEKPRLLVGAVEVRAGTFKAFDSRKDVIVPETILASAAIPLCSKRST